MHLLRQVTIVILSTGLLLSFGSANGQSESTPDIRENSKTSVKKSLQNGELNTKAGKGERGEKAEKVEKGEKGEVAGKPSHEKPKAYKIQDPCDKRPELPQCGISGPKK